jgi:polysaccharide export outer membrane protein
MGLIAPVAVAFAEPVPVRHDAPYHLDAGDKLRVIVYGQEGLTNTYAIDASGAITMPLIGSVPARGRTPAGLASEIAAKLRRGYIRDPSVAVEIDAYRPFFILGEVAAPGQYPYVPNMTVESAVAIAGGFSPRARRDSVTLTHTDASGSGRFVVPLGTPLRRPTSRFASCTQCAPRSAAFSAISWISPTARSSAATMSASSRTASPAASAPRRRWRKSPRASNSAFDAFRYAANPGLPTSWSGSIWCA